MHHKAWFSVIGTSENSEQFSVISPSNILDITVDWDIKKMVNKRKDEYKKIRVKYYFGP